jgi:hypothetical protein
MRTRYRFKVKRIAPAASWDREAALAVLEAFCCDPDTADRYSWRRAGPWAGRSALMSWFVLNPRPGGRVLSFFVTARLAGQPDRGSFVDNKLQAGVVRVGSTIRWTGVPAAMPSLVSSRCRVRF